MNENANENASGAHRPGTGRPFFVYGTLRPGGRHHDRFLRGRTDAEEEALLPDAMLHDGPGYPYAVAAPGAGPVTGTLLTAAPGTYTALLDALDLLEIPAGYDRTARATVRLRDGARVSAWVYLAAPDAELGPPIPGGDWFGRADA